MSKRRILIQLDVDKHPSTFDRVVAVDGGAEEIFSYGGIEPGDVEGLVYGGMFTRGPKDLHATAFFIGGSDVEKAQAILEKVKKTFFGPFRCSVLLDANGANTTASAAVLAARKHVDLSQCQALVAAGTGPVGQRAALLLARQGARVWLGSRKRERAEQACKRIQNQLEQSSLSPLEIGSPESVSQAGQFDVVISAGAATVQTLSRDHLQGQKRLKVVIDLNAVPPAGIEGVEATDSGRESEGVFYYGAVGVGGTKMKIHKAAIARLFETNDLILDAKEVFDLGIELGL